MRETKAVEIPIIKDGKQEGIIQKYYKYGMWNYRAIIFRPNGIISGNFFTLENAKEFIKLSNEANNAK
jgi:hypothetical protein